MTPVMLVMLLVLMSASVPVAMAIGFTSIVAIEGFTTMPLLVVVQRLFAAVDNEALLALPLFILAGNLMEVGGASQRLVDFAKSIVGGLQGGLALTCVLTCMIFAAISGSGIATTFTVGAILIPAMVRHGYPAGFAVSLQATAAELGVIIPPSITMILYGLAAQVSIGDLFLAGFGPGLLIGFALMATAYVWCRLTGRGQGDGTDRPRPGAAFRGAWPALLMPVIVLGGIYGGIFTPTESSTIAVFYALFLGRFVYRGMGVADLAAVLKRSALAVSCIMLIIAMSAIFSFVITRSGAPADFAAWLTSVLDSKFAFLVAVNLFLFVVGMFVDGGAAILVLAPILAPIAASYGIDPIHFGIIVIVNLALGMVTPPFGVNLFAACAVGRISLEQAIRYLLPFVAVVATCLMLVTYVPDISIGLKRLLF